MRKFLGAVRLSDAQTREVLSQYDLGSPKRVDWLTDGYQSDNYTLITDRGKYCLRVIYEGERRLEYILGLYEYVASRGIPTAKPVRTREGELYAMWEGNLLAIQTFVEGKSGAEVPKPLPLYGKELGRLHCALVGAPGAGQEGVGSLPSVRRLSEGFPPDDFVRREYQGLQDEIASLPLSAFTRGVVHGDPGPKDFYFEGDRLVGVLDFGAACPDYILYDLATMMMYTWIVPAQKKTDYQSFMRAYLESFPLPREELGGLHAFLRARFLIQVFYHWMRYREAVTQGLSSPQDNLEGVEDGKAMLKLLAEVPTGQYLIADA